MKELNQFRTAFRLPDDLIQKIDVEVDRLNEDLDEPVWNRSKVFRQILRIYFKSEGGDDSED